MAKIYLLIAVAIIVFIIFWQPWKKINEEEIQIKLNNYKISAEVVNTPAARSKGLMFRKSLGENNGMLFIFPNSAKHTFWMANTYIPLDIIWINQNKEIVHIEKNVPPCTKQSKIKNLCTHYKPDTKAKYVLEVNADWTSNKEIAVGTKVEF